MNFKAIDGNTLSLTTDNQSLKTIEHRLKTRKSPSKTPRQPDSKQLDTNLIIHPGANHEVEIKQTDETLKLEKRGHTKVVRPKSGLKDAEFHGSITILPSLGKKQTDIHSSTDQLIISEPEKPLLRSRVAVKRRVIKDEASMEVLTTAREGLHHSNLHGVNESNTSPTISKENELNTISSPKSKRKDDHNILHHHDLSSMKDALNNVQSNYLKQPKERDLANSQPPNTIASNQRQDINSKKHDEPSEEKHKRRNLKSMIQNLDIISNKKSEEISKTISTPEDPLKIKSPTIMRNARNSVTEEGKISPVAVNEGNLKLRSKSFKATIEPASDGDNSATSKRPNLTLMIEEHNKRLSTNGDAQKDAAMTSLGRISADIEGGQSALKARRSILDTDNLSPNPMIFQRSSTIRFVESSGETKDRLVVTKADIQAQRQKSIAGRKSIRTVNDEAMKSITSPTVSSEKEDPGKKSAALRKSSTIKNFQGNAPKPSAAMYGKMFKNWKTVLVYAKFGVSLVVGARLSHILEIPLKDNGQMAFIMQMYKASTDASLSKKINQLLDPSLPRNRELLNNIDKLLSYRLKSFALFQLEKRMKLCKVMRYEQHPGKMLICKEGQKALNFYFILSGKVEIFSIKDGLRTRLNVMNAGDCLGRLQLVNDVRMASIATLTDTEFLVVDKAEFASVSQVQTDMELQDQLLQLSKLEHFRKHPDFLKQTNTLFDLCVYSTNDTILTEGGAEHRVHFILQGSCKCVKKIPFIQKKTASKELSIMEPGQVIGNNEELVEHLFIIQELDTSDHFPGISIDAREANKTHNDPDNTDHLIPGHVGAESDFDPTLVEYSVIATSRVEVASIPRVDYIKYATQDMIEETLHQKNLYNVSIKEVQLSFLEKMNWDNFKKNVVGKIPKRK
ncbi:Cyclic nucleotide-binding domain-containing protein 2 [Globomyces sp. JEL0801]|nr:Cyclic nucleotide-binding domain-containing protein 2 [Globomyces sp. JEL0801]